MSNNHGLNIFRELAGQSEDDWVFGATSEKCRASIPVATRLSYLPQGETQRGKEDTMDCASRAPTNILESKFNYLMRNGLLREDEYQWLDDNGYVGSDGITFSDAFVAILSGTTQQGNSLKDPLQAIHDYGMVPKKLVPLDPSMTWAQYMSKDRITEDLLELGRQFLARFPIFYEKVYTADMLALVQQDFADVGGYAWPARDATGIYPRVDFPFNHAFVVFGTPEYQVFDNYPETEGDYIKMIAPDYKLLDYGYRVFIGTPQSTSIPEDELQSLVDKLLTLLFDFVKKLLQLLHV